MTKPTLSQVKNAKKPSFTYKYAYSGSITVKNENIFDDGFTESAVLINSVETYEMFRENIRQSMREKLIRNKVITEEDIIQGFVILNLSKL